MIITLSVLMCVLCCRCCIVGRRRAILLKQRLARLEQLEEESEAKKQRGDTYIQTALNTDMDIGQTSLYSTASAVMNEDCVTGGDLSQESSLRRATKAILAPQQRELSRMEASAGQKCAGVVTMRRADNDRRFHTTSNIGNRNTSHGGNVLFARVAAKDLKTFSSVLSSSSSSSPQLVTTKKRRSFRSEFEFRLKTEVLNDANRATEKSAEVQVEAESSENYFTRLEKQLEKDTTSI